MARHRVYDHRLRELFAKSGDPNLSPELNIPKSTVKTWIRFGTREVVTHQSIDDQSDDLIIENESLKRKLQIAEAQSKLIQGSFTAFGFSVQTQRLPHAESKFRILELVRESAKFILLRQCLTIIQLSRPRFQRWLSLERGCGLGDQDSCPRSVPHRLNGTSSQCPVEL